MKAVSRRSATLLVGVAAAAVAVAIVASGATARTAQTGRVCVLLPDTDVVRSLGAVRQPAFIKAFKKAGVTATVVNALNVAAEAARAGRVSASTRARRSAIITTLDTGTSIAIQKKFTAVGRQDDRLRPPDRRRHRHVYVSFDNNAVGRAAGAGRRRRHEGEGHVRSRRVVAAALGRPDRRQRVLVQERQRRRPQPAVQGEEDHEGPGEVRARLGQPEGADDLRADAHQDEQQDRRRRSRPTTASRDAVDRGAEGAEARSRSRSPARTRPLQGVQNILAGWQMHDRLQVRASRRPTRPPQRRSRCSRARSREVNGTVNERQAGSARRPASRRSAITKANNKRLFTDGFLEAERRAAPASTRSTASSDVTERWGRARAAPPRGFSDDGRPPP